MWNSYREEDVIPDSMTFEEETGEKEKSGITWKRICATCELRKRQHEWTIWSDAQKDKEGEDYPTWARVIRDMKRVNKGKLWNDTAAHISEASRQVKK